jgi:hypothetical protein
LRQAWGWRLVAYGLLLLLLTALLQGGVVLASPASAGRMTTLGAVAACTAALLATWVMMSAVESRPPASLGLILGSPLARDGARGLAIGLTLIGSVVGAMVLLGWARPSGAGSAGGTSVVGLADVTFLLLFAAFVEELVLRGYPFQVVARAKGPGVAVGSTATVFAVLHGANPGVGWTAIGNTLLAGILLGILYWRTLSLWLVTGAHFAWNWAMGVAAGLPVSGLDVGRPLARWSVNGPVLWTGGAYGPEAGLLLTLAALAGIAWAASTPSLSRDPAVLALGPLVGEMPEPEAWHLFRGIARARRRTG